MEIEITPPRLSCHVVELRRLRIATISQPRGNRDYIADVNETYISTSFSRNICSRSSEHKVAPKFASELSDGLCLLAYETCRCAFVAFKHTHCSAITKRRHIYTAGWELQRSRGKTVICGASCLQSNILSSKWRRCCSCGACGDSAGGWIPSPAPASCNNSVPFSPLNDHSLNGLISVGGTV